MNIGWFSWQPGLLSDVPNSAGGAAWTKYLFTKFVNAGHNVVWLAGSKPPVNTYIADLEKCDVLFINWRWEMPEYPERHVLYARQRELLDEAFKLGKRVIVHDQDHKISESDFQLLIDHEVQITAPEIFPREHVSQLFFPNPYRWRYSLENRMPFLVSPDMSYVGNVYERYEQALKFFPAFSAFHETFLYGNWVEEGLGRPSPDQVRSDMPNVIFKGRISEAAVIDVLVTSNSTIHLFKPSYGPVGFVTMRWAEAAVACTPAFIPKNFALPTHLAMKLDELGFIVEDGEDLLKKYNKMSEGEWEAGVEVQRAWVRENLTVEPWLALVEGEKDEDTDPAELQASP